VREGGGRRGCFCEVRRGGGRRGCLSLCDEKDSCSLDGSARFRGKTR